MFCGIVWPVFHGSYAQVGLSDFGNQTFVPAANVIQ